MLKVICILWGGGLCTERLLLEGKGIAQAGRKHFKNKFTEPKGSGAFICAADSAYGHRVGVGLAVCSQTAWAPFLCG